MAKNTHTPYVVTGALELRTNELTLSRVKAATTASSRENVFLFSSSQSRMPSIARIAFSDKDSLLRPMLHFRTKAPSSGLRLPAKDCVLRSPLSPRVKTCFSFSSCSSWAVMYSAARSAFSDRDCILQPGLPSQTGTVFYSQVCLLRQGLYSTAG